MEEILEKLEEIERAPFGLAFNPVETIKEGLFHTEEEVRQYALQLAGAFGSPEFIKPLFHLTAEAQRLETRLEALKVLGDFLHEGRISDYHRVDEQQADPQHKPETKRLSRSQFQAIRDFLGRAVREQAWPAMLRAKALEYFAAVETKKAKRTIEKFYNSGDSALAEGALKAISRVHGGKWRNIIMQEITARHNQQRRQAAVEAAGAQGIKEAGPELLNILKSSDNEKLRLAAIEALSMLNWSEAPHHLEKFREDKNPEVRQIAKKGMLRQASAHEKNRF